MMDNESQLKLQAFLDGELPETEAREMAAWMARDAEAKDMVTELRNTRKALKDSQINARVPESREFYWSKIQRQIERLEPVSEPVKSRSVLQMLRRILLPVGAIALVAIIGIFAGQQAGLIGKSFGADSEMTVADAAAFTYHDYAHGTTLVWVSYPSEK